MRYWLGVFLGLCCVGLTQAVELPDMGGSLNTVMSLAEEQQLGQAFMRRLRQETEVIDDPEIDAYLRGLGYRLVAHSESPEQPFTFFVVKDPSINAFAVPGGYIGVHSGLILHTQGESELASVLAHEIAHVSQRHIARTVESTGKFSVPMMAAALAALIVGMKNPQIGQAALASLQAGSIQMQINFTREHEREADRVGMHTLAGAGFNPRSMPDFFEHLQATSRHGETGFPEFLRTHPVTTERIAESKERAEQYAAPQESETPGFFLMRAKLLVMTSDDPGKLVKQLRQALEIGKYRDARAVHYALALALLETRDAAGAREELAWLREQDTDRAAYRLLAARLALLEEKPQDAMQLYAQALRVYPGDKLLSLGYARVLLENRQPVQARDILQAMSAPYSPEYYRLLAEAHKAAGASGEAYLALAEHYYLNGQTSLALEQLRLARKEKLDFYIGSRIEAKLTQLEEEFTEEQKQKQDDKESEY